MRSVFAMAAMVLAVASGCSISQQHESEQPLQAAAQSGTSPAEDGSGHQGADTPVPLTDRDARDLRTQVEDNWNLGELAVSPDVKDMVVELRVHLLPDGTVTKIDLLNARPDNPAFGDVAESAKRAVMIASPLELPPGKSWDTIKLIFHPDRAIE